MNTSTLAGRTVLITGATGGLGAPTAKACAAAGATVVLLGRTIPRLERLYDEIMAAGGPIPAIYPLDLSGAVEKDYQDLALTLETEFGALHGLIHCAAELGNLGLLADVDAAVWERRLQVNLTAPFLLTGALLPLLLGTPNATVVFTTDSVARTGKAYWGAYGVAKIGLEGYARILGEETEGRLRVRVFEPGPMRTPLRRRAYPGENPDSLTSPEAVAERLLELLAAPA